MITAMKKQELLFKHGKKFASKNEATPILQGVHFAKDLSANVCDRHQLLRIKDAHEYSEEKTVNPQTGDLIDGTYPSVANLFPKDFHAEILFSEDQIKEKMSLVKIALDTCKFKKDKTNLVTLNIDKSNLVTLDVVMEFEFLLTVHLGQTDGRSVDPLTFNAEFLFNAMQVFKDAGSKSATLKIVAGLQPIVMSDEENGIDVLWLPYRLAKKQES